MNDVKWIKITTDMFDNRKIKHLRKLPDGDRIVLIWVMLLTLAGRCNSGGMIFLTENIPYTPKMLADELDFEENTVTLALEALERFDMIRRDGFIMVSGWDEYQSSDKLDKIRENARLRKQRQRERERALIADGHVTVTGQECDSLHIELELEKEKELDIEIEKDTRVIGSSTNYQEVVDLYNSICVSFPKIRALSDARKKAIGARLKKYTIDDVREVFQKAEASSFLKGANDRNWMANFDWLMKDTNLAKVLDGNYDDRGRNGGVSGVGKKVHGDWKLRADVE